MLRRAHREQAGNFIHGLLLLALAEIKPFKFYDLTAMRHCA
jgi:hypothetical protein